MNKMITHAEMELSNTLHYHIYGNIYNDNRFPNGCYIKTSRLLKFFKENGILYAETKHNTYEIDEKTSHIWPSIIDEYLV